MDPILPAARSSLLEINLCLMAPYDMTDGTRHKWIQTQVHLHKNSSLSPYPFPPPCFHSLRAEAWKTVFKPDFLFLNTRKISCLSWSTSCTLEIWFGSGFAKTWRFDMCLGGYKFHNVLGLLCVPSTRGDGAGVISSVLRQLGCRMSPCMH